MAQEEQGQTSLEDFVLIIIESEQYYEEQAAELIRLIAMGGEYEQ